MLIYQNFNFEVSKINYMIQGPKLSQQITLNASENLKREAKIFVQDIFCECKSVDQNIESNLPVCEII